MPFTVNIFTLNISVFIEVRDHINTGRRYYFFLEGIYENIFNIIGYGIKHHGVFSTS